MIKVMIERQVGLDMIDHYQKASKAILRQALQAPGFISGESLKDANDENHRMIIVSYQDYSHWNHWYNSEARRESMNELRPMLEGEEKITIFQHI